ncbi:MAG: hypothetical protein E7178_04645 [Erysipelotrichaceae bacterium]|nr:hypothetical protein [Erysipelotrichaceae bacterium]
MISTITLKNANKDHVRLLAEGVYGFQFESDKQLKTFLDIFNETLTGNECAVLIYRHGLEKGASAKSLFESQEVFGVTREMIRQIENRAFFKLKSPANWEKINGVKSKISTLSLDTKIVDCDLLTRSINLLKNSKIKTIKDLLNMKLEDFFKLKSLDIAIIKDVQTFIRDINL